MKRRLYLLALALATVGIIVTFGAPSVQTGFEQNAQTKEAESTAAELEARIDQLTREVELRTSGENVWREALCFGPYVAPGAEVYAVLGVSGCIPATRQG